MRSYITQNPVAQIIHTEIIALLQEKKNITFTIYPDNTKQVVTDMLSMVVIVQNEKWSRENIYFRKNIE